MPRDYPVIGGPLDGKRAVYRSFCAHVRPDHNAESGEFAEHSDDYVAYNNAIRYTKAPTMVFLWRGLLLSDPKDTKS